MRGPKEWLFGGLLALSLCVPPAVGAAPGGEPPRFTVAVPASGPITFVVYGDTRFTRRDGVANPVARRALVARIADENPAAIFVGGDLVYEGTDADDYATYRSETLDWARRSLQVFPALGNHEYRGCEKDDPAACLDNWWEAFPVLHLRPYRWYSVSVGPAILALVLDSDSPLKPGSEQFNWLDQEISGADTRLRFLLLVLHYPPVRDPVFPHGKDEAEIERYLSARIATLHARVVVVGSHVHNYERFNRNGVMYLVSGGGGAKPVPAFHMSGELSQLKTPVNFHYLRFTLENGRLDCTMVRFDAADQTGNPWSEPDRFELTAGN